MFYSIAADTLLLVHLAFIVFVILGGLLLVKWPRLIYLHLTTVSWGVLVEFNHWLCPLTPWENDLRQLAGESRYQSSFIEHYLVPIIYPINLTNDIQLFLGGFVILINLVIYSWLFIKMKKNHSNI